MLLDSCSDKVLYLDPITKMCVPYANCSMSWCGNGDCTIFEGERHCQCYADWKGNYCNISSWIVNPTNATTDQPPVLNIAAIVVPIVVGLVFLILLGMFSPVYKHIIFSYYCRV